MRVCVKCMGMNDQMRAYMHACGTTTICRLKDIPKEEVMPLVTHMVQSTFPAGKEWDPSTDQQIYFIKQGGRARWLCTPHPQASSAHQPA